MRAYGLSPAGSRAPRRMPGELAALALGGDTFGIGLTEFLIAGLLPPVASSVAVSECPRRRRAGGSPGTR